jgi:alanyl-tRNA synthetase
MRLSLFAPVIEKIIALAPENKKKPHHPDLERSYRIIADHIRAATFIMGDPWEFLHLILIKDIFCDV